MAHRGTLEDLQDALEMQSSAYRSGVRSGLGSAKAKGQPLVIADDGCEVCGTTKAGVISVRKRNGIALTLCGACVGGMHDALAKTNAAVITSVSIEPPLEAQ